jgi:hypothetical protein
MKARVKACRRAGVPLVGIETSDYAAAEIEILSALNGKKDTTPLVRWDMIRGAQGVNPLGNEWVGMIAGGQDPRIATCNPTEFASICSSLPNDAVCLLYGAALVLADQQARMPYAQALWNLRDVLKQRGATVFVMGPLGWTLPPELVGDVVMLSHALPSEQQLREIATEVMKSANVTTDDAGLDRIVDAVAGIKAYAAENEIAMSLSKDGVDYDLLWSGKCKAIEQTKGLSVYRGKDTEDEVAGYDSAKQFLKLLFAGDEKYRILVWIDEVEKHFAGNAGDLSGTSQEMTGNLLSWWQNTSATGIMFYGVSGSGKSAMAKAAASMAGCPLISLDFSGLKGSLVGESGARLRAALQAVDAMGRGRVLVISTCNGVAVLAPEMRRRLGGLGVFFFDLPTEDERAGIWTVWMKKSGLAVQTLPVDTGWTGAEIAQCCTVARKLNIPLVSAAKWVVPISRSSANVIEEQRQQASGKFLSASSEGIYTYTKMAQPMSGRKVEV